MGSSPIGKGSIKDNTMVRSRGSGVYGGRYGGRGVGSRYIGHGRFGTLLQWARGIARGTVKEHKGEAARYGGSDDRGDTLRHASGTTREEHALTCFRDRLGRGGEPGITGGSVTCIGGEQLA